MPLAGLLLAAQIKEKSIIMSEETTVQAQCIYDAFRLLDKDLIDKVLAIASVIKVEKLAGGITRISIDVVEK
jgi:hypothetical protein